MWPADVAQPKNFGPKVDTPTTPSIPETIFRIRGPFFDVGFTKVENYNISKRGLREVTFLRLGQYTFDDCDFYGS